MRLSSITTWTSRLFVPVALVVIAALVALVAFEPSHDTPDATTASAASLDVPVVTVFDESIPHTHDTAPDGSTIDHVHDGATTSGTVHDHSSATVGSVSTDHTHDTSAPGGAVSGPIVTVDDPRLSPAQQTAARNLLVSSRATIASLPDANALRAAGYEPVGDNSSGMQHWVNDAYTHDGRELDPSHIESLMTNRSTGRTTGAMYILEPGRTMGNVPDIAGELTLWHVHAPICFSTTQTWQLVSFASNRTCPAGAAVRDVPPMMHVWLDDPACGPFVGTEGHGSTGCAAHTH